MRQGFALFPFSCMNKPVNEARIHQHVSRLMGRRDGRPASGTFQCKGVLAAPLTHLRRIFFCARHCLVQIRTFTLPESLYCRQTLPPCEEGLASETRPSALEGGEASLARHLHACSRETVCRATWPDVGGELARSH